MINRITIAIACCLVGRSAFAGEKNPAEVVQVEKVDDALIGLELSLRLWSDGVLEAASSAGLNGVDWAFDPVAREWRPSRTVSFWNVVDAGGRSDVPEGVRAVSINVFDTLIGNRFLMRSWSDGYTEIARISQVQVQPGSQVDWAFDSVMQRWVAQEPIAEFNPLQASLERCTAADVARPWGLLDLRDLNDFIDAFLLGDILADLAKPFGAIDLADINVFISSFTTGCESA